MHSTMHNSLINAIILSLFFVSWLSSLIFACLNTCITYISFLKTFMINHKFHHHYFICCLRTSNHSKFGVGEGRSRRKMTITKMKIYKVVKFFFLLFIFYTFNCMIVFHFFYMHACSSFWKSIAWYLNCNMLLLHHNYHFEFCESK